MFRKLLPNSTILSKISDGKLISFQTTTPLINNSIFPPPLPNLTPSVLGNLGPNVLVLGAGNVTGPTVPYLTTDSLTISAIVGAPTANQHTNIVGDTNFELYLDNNFVPNIYFYSTTLNLVANTAIYATGGGTRVNLSNGNAYFYISLDNGVTWRLDATVSLGGMTISNASSPLSIAAPFVYSIVLEKNNVIESQVDFSNASVGVTTVADNISGTWVLNSGASIAAIFIPDSYTRPLNMVKNPSATSFYTNTFQLQNQSTTSISGFGKTISFTIPQGAIPFGQTINITETDGTTIVPFRILKIKRWSDNSLWRITLDIRPSETFSVINTAGDTHSYKINAINGTPTIFVGGVSISDIAAQNFYVQIDGSWSFGTDIYRMTFADVIANCAGPSSCGTGALVTTMASASTTLQFSLLTANVTDELGQTQIFAVSVGMHVFGTGVPSVFTGATGVGKGNNLLVPSGVTVTAINTTNNSITLSHVVNVSANTSIRFAYPVQGYEIRKSGLDFYFWSYAKRVSDGAFDRWLRIDSYVQAWTATGAWSIKCGVENPNIYGSHPTGSVGVLLNPVSGTNYGNRSPRYFFRMTLWNGTTQIGNDWGGVNDPNAFTKTPANISNGNFDYWSDSFYQAISPVGGSSVIPAPLVADTPYCCTGYTIIAYPNASNITLTSTGSGSFILYPICALSSGQKVIGLDTTGLPAWWQGSSSIAAHPVINFIPDLIEITTKTALVPSYALEQPTYPRNCLLTSDRGFNYHLSHFQVGGIQPWGYALNNYGDDPGDERVGYLTNLTANWFFQPRDPYITQMLRIETARFSDYVFNWRNEETGLLQVLNMGPARTNSSNYAALGTSNPNLQMIISDIGRQQSGGWSTFSDYTDGPNTMYYTSYGPITDNSHHPFPMFLSACMEDDEYALDQFLAAVNTLLASNTINPRNWINPQTGQQLSGIAATLNNQVRGIGWQLRGFVMLEQLLYDGHRFQPVIRDILDDTAQYLPQCIIDNPSQNGGPNALALGIFGNGGYNVTGDTYFGVRLGGEHVFFDYITAFCLGMASWIDKYQQRRPGFAHVIDHFQRHFIIDMFDDAGQGSDFLVDMYNFPCGDSAGNILPSISAVYQNTWGQYNIPWKYSIGVIDDYSDVICYVVGNGPPITTLSGRVPQSTDNSSVGGKNSYPFGTGLYGSYRAAALSVWANAGHPDAERLWLHYKARLETLPCLGICWAQQNNGHYDLNTPQNYVAWCIKPTDQASGINDLSP